MSIDDEAQREIPFLIRVAVPLIKNAPAKAAAAATTINNGKLQLQFAITTTATTTAALQPTQQPPTRCVCLISMQFFSCR